MKYVINGKVFIKKYVSGVQRYTLEMINSLDKIVTKDEIEILVPKKAKHVPKYQNLKVIPYGKFHNLLWEQVSLPFYARKNKRISINLGNTSPWINPGIVCIHDINCIRNPKNFSIGNRIWYHILFYRACRKAKKIITVSEFSKSEIQDKYKVGDNRIEVIYNAWQHFQEVQEDNSILDDFSQLKEKEYFFSIGTLTKHKNFEWVLEVAKRNPQYYFAVAGFSQSSQIYSELHQEELPNVIYVGYLRDEKLKAVLKKAKALLFPSFYEGFGIPPIEALSVGTKVIASQIPVLKEIYQNSIYYIDPKNTEVNLDEILENPVEAGEKVLLKYSWEKSAKQLYTMLKKID